jgi:hypothetical protein
MGTITEIEAAVRKLSPSQLSRFRKWFQEFDAQEWDRQFEDDVRSGKLDELASEATKDLREGRCKQL